MGFGKPFSPKSCWERWLVLEIFAVASCFVLFSLLWDAGLDVPSVIFRLDHVLVTLWPVPVMGTESQIGLWLGPEVADCRAVGRFESIPLKKKCYNFPFYKSVRDQDCTQKTLCTLAVAGEGIFIKKIPWRHLEVWISGSGETRDALEAVGVWGC